MTTLTVSITSTDRVTVSIQNDRKIPFLWKQDSIFLVAHQGLTSAANSSANFFESPKLKIPKGFGS
jgi:hypothetical protein